MKIKNIRNNILFICILFIWLLPFTGLIVSSLRPGSEIINGWWHLKDSTLTFQNYVSALTSISLPLAKPLWNSLIISIFSTLCPMILGSLAGYGFARYTIPYKIIILAVLLSSMAVPIQMISIPVFNIMSALGLIDSFISVVIINTVTAIPWIVFLLMNFILSIPIEIEEAACIDGCSSLNIFLRITLAQILPAFVSVFVLQFVWSWMDVFLPLIFLYSPEKYVSVQIIPLLRGHFVTDWGLLSAASLVIAAPPILLFLFLKKYYILGSIGWINEK